MRLNFRKIRPAVPYSNPGSRFSKLGYRRAAVYGMYAGNRVVGMLYCEGKSGVWTVEFGGRYLSAGSLRDAKATALRLWEREQAAPGRKGA